MNSLQLKAIIAGMLFGMWPLFMNRSGLSGNVSSIIFGAMVLICVSVFGIRDLFGGSNDFTQVNWVMVVLAGLAGGIGILAFNGMLATATPQSVGTLFVLMIVVQTVVPAIYSVVMNGSVSATKAAGFALATVAAVLLTR